MSGLVGNPLLLTAAAGAAAYEIPRSIRLNSADSAYLSRTPASAGNRKTWTWAGWLKKVKNTNGLLECMFGVSGNTDPYFRFQFRDDNTFFIEDYNGSIFNADLRSTSVYRDPSAWYHIVLAVDTTQATSSNRIKLYVNGVQVTSFSTATYPSQNADLIVNSTVRHDIGNMGIYYSPRYFNGYLADIHFIDGQALDPSSFGEFDTNNVWQPIAYSGSYGTNGFHLDFADNSSAAALGYDAAGSNDWTVNNISVTAGTGNDSLVESPTNYGTDTGAGGEVRGNYNTMNLFDCSSTVTLSNGNLDTTRGFNTAGGVRSVFPVTSGKWYFEFHSTYSSAIGVATDQFTLGTFLGSDAYSWSYEGDSGRFWHNNTYNTTFQTWINPAVIGVAIDRDNGRIWWSKDGTWYINPTTSPNSGVFNNLSGNIYVCISTAVSAIYNATGSFNFGQRPWTYPSSVPAGFKAFCTANLPTPAVPNGKTAMDAVTYTGNGSTQTISSLSLEPDLIWIKSRSATRDNNIYDVVRGSSLLLSTNGVIATTSSYNLYAGDRGEQSVSGVTSFNSNGFSLGNSSVANGNSESYIAWAWDAGSTTASGRRTNSTAGISIISYTGNGSSARGLTTGLTVPVDFLLIKCRNTATTASWIVWHQNITSKTQGALALNTTELPVNTSSHWGDVSPDASSTQVQLGDSIRLNGNGLSYVMYAFTAVSGFSSFGKYIGNNSTDGPFVYTGFRSRWILIKLIDSLATYPWEIYDTARSTYNAMNVTLAPNTPTSETSQLYPGLIDVTANGFKIRSSNATSYINYSGGTYIYAAFAEHPFSLARAR